MISLVFFIGVCLKIIGKNNYHLIISIKLPEIKFHVADEY